MSGKHRVLEGFRIERCRVAVRLVSYTVLVIKKSQEKQDKYKEIDLCCAICFVRVWLGVLLEPLTIHGPMLLLLLLPIFGLNLSTQ